MGKTKYQTRLDPDDAERVDAFKEDHDVNESEAVRRLVRTGLEVERDDGAITDTRDHAEARMNETIRTIGGALIALGMLFLVLTEMGLL